MKNITIILLLLLSTEWPASAQEFSDSSLSKTDDQKLGNQFLQKSKNQKVASLVSMGISMASGIALSAVANNNLIHSLEGESVSNGGMIALGAVMVGSAVTTIGFMTASAKNAGKADMLLHSKSSEAPGQDIDRAMQYHQKAHQQRLTGWVLLGTGITMIVVAPWFNKPDVSDQPASASKVIMLGGCTAVAASGHFFMKASKNKGRATILLKKDSIPFSYLSKPVGLRSVAVSIPF